MRFSNTAVKIRTKLYVALCGIIIFGGGLLFCSNAKAQESDLRHKKVLECLETEAVQGVFNEFRRDADIVWATDDGEFIYIEWDSYGILEIDYEDGLCIPTFYKNIKRFGLK